MIRAKFQVNAVEHFEGTGVNIKMFAICDNETPEDAKFIQATPSGQLNMYCTNHTVTEQMTPGKKFYLDFTEVEK